MNYFKARVLIVSAYSWISFPFFSSRISGYIETDIWNTVAQIENLAGGVARSLDLGTGEALVNYILRDPDFAEDIDRYGRLDYTVTLVEQSSP